MDEVLSTRPVRILVIDDEEQIRAWMLLALSAAGYHVDEAADGEQGLTLARRQWFDLVITDLVMPEKEGVETIRELRELCPGTRIIAMTGAFIGDFLKVVEKLGASATLTKPFSSAELLQQVRAVLEPPAQTH
jgi:DNA-binding response OmpR family regulator